MARLTKRERRKFKRKVVVAAICFMRVVNTTLMLYMLVMDLIAERFRRRPIRMDPNVYQRQIDALHMVVGRSDKDCHNLLRVNRHTFMRLIHLLEERGLQNSRNVNVVEKVAIFLWILAHHNKNRPTKFQFLRSGETISRHFNAIL